MTKKKTVALLLALVLAAGCLTGCTTYDNFKAAYFPEEPDPEAIVIEPVRIGVFEPLTGASAADAAAEIKGIELAHRLYGKVLERPVELVYADNRSDVAYATDAANELVSQHVSVVLGSYGSVLSLAGSDIFREARIPAISVTNSNPIVTQANPYYSRACSIDASQGAAAASYVFEKLQRRWAYVFYQSDDDYYAAMADQFVAKTEEIFGSTLPVIEKTFSSDTTDFSGYLRSLDAIGCRCIYFPCSAELGETVIYTAMQMGYDFEWIGCSQWEDLLAVGAAAERGDSYYLNNASFVADYDADTDLSDMTEVFKIAYGAIYPDETPDKAAALGFDAYLLALEGIRQAERSDAGTLIANKLSNITGFKGATGTYNMSSSGDPMKDVVIEKIKNGETSATYTVNP